MKHLIRSGIFCILITLSIFSSPASTPLTPKQNDAVFDILKPWIEIIYNIEQRYVQEVDYKKSLNEAIKAFIKCLDSHSDFMDPKLYAEIIAATQGEFGGIGVIIDNNKKTDDESILIIEVIPTKAAETGGLRADDRIVQINNEVVKGMSIDEIIAKLKGPPATKVHLKILRNGTKELLSYDITRELIQEQNAVCYYFKDSNIYYLALNMFTEKSVQHLEQLLKKSQKEQSKGLILDLRNNSGGLLSAVTQIAGLFMKQNTLVIVTKDRNKKVLEKYFTTRKPIADNSIPIFILMNNYTASAAEILAGRLQKYSEQEQTGLQVFLVGSKTFGKGSVQEVIPMHNECALKLTTALYYFPDNTSIQGVGIQPDFSIQPRFAETQDMLWFNTFFGHESSLKNSIQVEDNKKQTLATEPKKETWQERKQAQLGSDHIILSTVRLIEMLDIAKIAYPQKMKTRKSCNEFLHKNYLTNDKIVMEEIKI